MQDSSSLKRTKQECSCFLFYNLTAMVQSSNSCGTDIKAGIYRNRIEYRAPNLMSYICKREFSTRVPRPFTEKRTMFSNWCWNCWMSSCKSM